MNPLRLQLKNNARLREWAQWGGLIAAGATAGALTFLVIDTMAPEAGAGPTDAAIVAAMDRAAARQRFYTTCTEARADGAAPILRGQPGYAPHLDVDNDGVACEPYAPR